MSERHTTWAEYRDALMEMPEESVEELIRSINDEEPETE